MDNKLRQKVASGQLGANYAQYLHRHFTPTQARRIIETLEPHEVATHIAQSLKGNRRDTQFLQHLATPATYDTATRAPVRTRTRITPLEIADMGKRFGGNKRVMNKLLSNRQQGTREMLDRIAKRRKKGAN
jgi:hypothetical protein